jgi:nickel/cobalt transporter (NicO) family protein
MIRVRRLLLATVLAALPLPALAHPHIWIEVRTTVVGDGERLVGLRHAWTFDPMFSSWEVQGMDANGDGRYDRAELAPLAARYAETLPPWGFFTEVRSRDGLEHALVGRELVADYDDGRMTLHLDLVLAEALPLADLEQVRVHDRTFFVALSYPAGGITADGMACAVFHHPPGQLDPALLARLDAIPADRRELPPELAERVRDAAHRIEVDCGAG